MNRFSRSIILAGIMACCAGAATTQAATFSDFESPTYTAGTSFVGVDGWIYPYGISFARVTPDPSVSGISTVLSGSQSAILSATTLGRRWNGLEYLVNTNSTFISVLVKQAHPSFAATASLYFSDDVPGGSTPAGLEFWAGGSFRVFGSAGYVNTGVTYDANDVYRLGMLFDFTNDTFTAFIDNVTDATPRVNLGTYDMVGAPKLVSNIRNNGGIFLDNPNSAGGWVPVWDDVELVPEPSAVVLLLAAGGLLLRRRRPMLNG
jgi:hypothetical protein